MTTIIEAMREVLGAPSPWVVDGVVHYELMFEYLASVLLLLIVVSSVFKILCRIFK